VPRISAFYGITIWMYWNEGVHARPHFHARYAGQAASVDFSGSGNDRLAGRLGHGAGTAIRRGAPQPGRLSLRGSL